MTVLLQGVVGSTAYGLATPSSDIDRLGFYAAPTLEVLGLDVVKVVQNTIVKTEPEDIQLHEVGKYLALALQGNPTILELLWLESYEVYEWQGELIRNSRDIFLSKQLAARYGGYVRQQAKRLETRWRLGQQGFDPDLAKRTPKHARHCYRLLIQGKQLLEFGYMNVRLGADERTDCFAAGELADKDPEAFRKFIDDELVAFDEVAEKSPLPDHPDRAEANYLLQRIRQSFL